ncbi:P-loop containing nucleoside triphosphate hydrolase protein [Epithele typhae]|uniref:P-loop containing nucleoside triphosphate hydrolase protein n=1 Tax=Epithele typhae TaxID=378194 RepID=UPI002008A97E|nr:P-loop containing nucleoside triphosphate hydrolase protein [Epithele typhae]KAH9925853.1 P-loop containing nucleoside triphosphate hydrolase protein [Epithele typhae]
MPSRKARGPAPPPPPPLVETYNQTFITTLPKDVPTTHLNTAHCRPLLDLVAQSAGPVVLGASFRLSKGGELQALALSSSTRTFLVKFDSSKGRPNELEEVLAHPSVVLADFNAPRVALVLWRRLRVHVRAVDLDEDPASLAKKVGFAKVWHNGVDRLWERVKDKDIALRAWLTANIVSTAKGARLVAQEAKVDTRKLQVNQLECLARLVTNVELLDMEKPTRSENEFGAVKHGKGDEGILLSNSRYKSRVRRSKKAKVNGKFHFRAVGTNGKTTSLVPLGKNALQGAVKSVCVRGREEATNEETCMDAYVLALLEGEADLLLSQFVKSIWFPQTGNFRSKPSSKARREQREAMMVYPAQFAKLNPSQREVAAAMVGDAQKLVVAHGPPGTGKTTTIAAALTYWEKNRSSAWVIAHSNVGVKNIAETLCRRGVDFKLIVSHEFHFDWHEHLYLRLSKHFIESNKLFNDKDNVRLLIGDTKILLCTVSMLSNPFMDSFGVFKHVSVQRLIVDEASQIDAFQFMHLFHKFKALEKVCLFGDPKQLPPFGKDTAPEMQTIFDFEHLQLGSYFLDTQYRMPIQLGRFISKHVYDAKLKSVHGILTRNCVRFVDVRIGREERVGSSWKNKDEVQVVVRIAGAYKAAGKSFCVITPYDPQRKAITDALKAAALPCEDVYNVDSYQGTSRCRGYTHCH